MDICFDSVCHLVINDQADILHVDTTTSEIGGDEDVRITGAQRLQSSFSLLLVLARVQGRGAPLQKRPYKHIKVPNRLSLRTPPRCRSFATMSAVFFWLTNTMIGGANSLLLKISNMRCLQ